MQVTDKRGIPFTITFGELAIGEAFQDKDGDICIKTNVDAYMYWSLLEEWVFKNDLDEKDAIVPLKVTYTIETEHGRK